MTTPEALRFKYKYLKFLGEGSTGKTFLAQDLNTGQQVAIKAFKAKSNEAFKNLELFKREAMTLSSISLPEVPRFYQSLFSSDLSEDNYIVQEFIDAPSLLSYIDENGKFSEQDTLIVMEKIARILNSLHSDYSPPIIHRDIKPSNILCKLPNHFDWQSAKLYLIDFGAVANACVADDCSTIAGTVGYMAPEQNFGEFVPQSDYFALGATALQMLTGIPPYQLDFELFTPKIDEALDAHAPDTSSNMRELLKTLLNLAKDKRPKDAQTLLEMIHNVQGNRTPVKAQPPRNFLVSFIDKLSIIFNKLSRSEAMATQRKTASGIIQYVDPSKVYYTFDVDDLTWQGIEDIENVCSRLLHTQQSDIIINAKCIVQYCSYNPRNSSIKSIGAQS